VNGPTQQDEALMLAVELTVVGELLDVAGMNTAGLALIRRKLRLHDTVEAVARYGLPALVEKRAVVLDRVSRLLAGDHPDTLDYYRGCGDLIDSAPDDASSLA
jgi:hypothetical protein